MRLTPTVWSRLEIRDNCTKNLFDQLTRTAPTDVTFNDNRRHGKASWPGTALPKVGEEAYEVREPPPRELRERGHWSARRSDRTGELV